MSPLNFSLKILKQHFEWGGLGPIPWLRPCSTIGFKTRVYLITKMYFNFSQSSIQYCNSLILLRRNVLKD